MMRPLAFDVLVLNPNEISDPELENQWIARFRNIKFTLFLLWRPINIKLRYIQHYFFRSKSSSRIAREKSQSERESKTVKKEHDLAWIDGWLAIVLGWDI